MGVAEAILVGSVWLWPVVGPVVTPFSAPTHPYAAAHRGIDIAADPGSPIRAAHRGVVSHVGRVGGVPTITVRDGRMQVTYQPVDSALRVGATLEAGDLLGALGRWSGHCTCLHLGVRVSGHYRDPLPFFRAPIVVKSPRVP